MLPNEASLAFPNETIRTLGHCEPKIILPNFPRILCLDEKLKCVLLFTDNLGEHIQLNTFF